MEISRFQNTINKIPTSVGFILSVYLSGILFFAIIRAYFYWSFSEALINVPTSIVFRSFLVGLRFDTVVICYILALPILLFIIAPFISASAQKRLFNFILSFIVLLFSIAFLISFANIPFYQNYHLPINKAALHWSNDVGFSVSMILQDIIMVRFLILFVFASVLFYLITLRLKKYIIKKEPALFKKDVFVLLLLLPLIAIGMRGRISYKSPIRWGTAFFSSYEIANQAALNPVFSFFKSASDNISQPFFDSDKAINLLYDNIKEKKSVSANDSLMLNNYNVVLILMESMGSNKTGLFVNGQKLTPFIDSLAKQSLFFKNCYSDGIHTFNGLFSTLTSFPALPMNKPLEDLRIQLPENYFIKQLKDKNYITFFFTTHDSQFDNMEGFMRKNGVEHIIGEAEFSRKEVLSATGVPDHILYNKSVAVFDTVNTPFFALILSGSDHAPYAIPENTGFKPQGNDRQKNIVAYADWAISNFFNTARHKKWFNNTLFVLVGDHGAIVDQEADMYLGMHHTPLIFYAYKKTIHEINDALCGQEDILPSIAHLIGINYSNKPFAVNLFKEERTTLTFTYDEHLIGINKSAFYVSRPYESNLFLINIEEKHCTVSADSILAKDLRNFSFATMEYTRQKLFVGK